MKINVGACDASRMMKKKKRERKNNGPGREEGDSVIDWFTQ